MEKNIEYGMVDLGLSVKWADRNVGSTSHERFGYYFAWGETAPRGEDWATEAPYDWAHAPLNDGSGNTDEEMVEYWKKHDRHKFNGLISEHLY